MSGSVTVLKNSTVTYTIEKEGYTTVTNTVVVSEDTSTTVTMDLALVTLTIEPDPSDATVTLTAAGYTQSGNSISVAPGTTVNYSVSKDGYTTVTGSEVCTINRTINCTLEIAYNASITFNITEESGYPLVYCSVGDYSYGTRGKVSNPVSITSELNGKTINCNAGDTLIVAAQSTTVTCVDLIINGVYSHSYAFYEEYNGYTVVEGPQTLTIITGTSGEK